MSIRLQRRGTAVGALPSVVGEQPTAFPTVEVHLVPTSIDVANWHLLRQTQRYFRYRKSGRPKIHKSPVTYHTPAGLHGGMDEKVPELSTEFLAGK